MPQPIMMPEEEKAYEEARRRIKACGPFGNSLSLTGLSLTALPPEIGQLQALTELYLRGNQLTTLPPEIGQLQSLTGLFVSGNKLIMLPPEIGQLQALTGLFLSGNQLNTLPPEIGRLQALTRLDLSNNLFVILPPEIGELQSLTGLFLHGNNGLGIPDDALGPSGGEVTFNKAQPKPPSEILDFYISSQGSLGEALREIKLIVVGWGKAGKTTLINRLNGWPMNLDEAETHGITISPLNLACYDGSMRARVWDFGGQHVLHAMHEFFLTARSLYLLVLEQRSDRAETDAKYWLQLIRSYAPEAPVVVALNKSRGVERSIDKDSLQKAFGPILAWVTTECLPEAECAGADDTIEALRSALTIAADAMDEARKRFPKKWLAIKDWLESLDNRGTNYLDYDTFSLECAQRGEPDAAKQKELTALMHDLGVALNYARDERLRDTTVLRPDWLANGIYAILRANLFLPGKLLAPDAVLTKEKLGEIYSVAAQKPVEMLKAEDYPPDKWAFLLQLMNLFQLSFPLDESGERQLCPNLLPAEPPQGTDEPTGDDTIRLRYEFPVVPAPLVPRFLVRIFPLIQNGKLWQRGTMLRYPGAQARVWTTPEEKYVFATVIGPDGDRAELLEIIRSTLVELFREYKELEVTEQRWFDGHWVPRATLEKFRVLVPDMAYEAEGEEEAE